MSLEMTNDNEEIEYIVKVKNGNINIINKNMEEKVLILIIAISFLLCWLLIINFEDKVNIIKSIVVLGGILLEINYVIKALWRLEVNNNQIILKRGKKIYLIDYSKLINVKKKYKKVYNRRTIYYVDIEFLKNNKIKHIFLIYNKKKNEEQINNLVNLFITNIQIGKQYLYNVSEEYFDIHDEEEKKKIVRTIIINRKKKDKKISIILVIILMIIIIFSIIYFKLK